MRFGFAQISKGFQAVFGLATTVIGALGDPSVVGYLPHKVAVPLTIAGAVIAALSHPPSTPISGNNISPKVAVKLGVSPPESFLP